MEEELLDKLEVLWLGQATPEQDAAWASFVQQHPEAVQISAEYERLWNGLIALRGTQFLAKMQAWDQTFQEHDDAELAEWFVTGLLHADNAKLIEERMTKDVVFAQLVQEQQQLNDGFSALKNDQLRDWMQEWDTEQDHQEQPEAKVVPMRRSWVRTLAVAAGFLLLLFAASTVFIGQQYDDQPLVEAYYEFSPAGNTLSAGPELGEYLQQFDQAHQALRAKEFDTAAAVFNQLSTMPPPADLGDDTTYYQENIEWNLLLARLGAGDYGGDFADRLGMIADDASHEHQAKATALRKDLASFWRIF